MRSQKNDLFLLAALVMSMTVFGCSAVDTAGDGQTNEIDSSQADAGSSDGGTVDAITLDGGCTPGTPIVHEDPCLVCSCGDDGVATCEPATAGVVCATEDCCIQAPTCQICEGDDCPTSGMACVGEAVFSCEDGNACTEDRAVCEEGVCSCQNPAAENGASCVVDANACTVGDTCQDGECVQGALDDMDDGNPCTAGVCVKGVIEQKPLDGPCSDGDPCTVGDTCILAQCVPDALKECPDLPCAEAGWCDSDVGDCVYDFKADGTACDAGNACGGEGVCLSGQCELEENPCDDLNPCTADICGADGSCQNLPLEDGTLCEDSAACTVSTCKSGLCQPVEGAGCDDGNPCTLDECDETGSCSYTSLEDGTSCGDDDVCNGEELCQSGSCEVSAALECQSDAPCMDSSCHPTLGCLNEPKDDGAPCGDDDVCNGEETCQGGACESTGPLKCESDDECIVASCDSKLGCQSTTIPNCGDDPTCGGYFGVLDGSTCIMVPDALSAMPAEFTIEFWIRPDADPYAPSLFDKIVDDDWSNPGFRIQYNANGDPYAESIHYQEINKTGGMNGQVTQLKTVPVGSWTHFAVSRTSDMKWKMFLNGVGIGSAGGGNHYVNQSNDEPLWIGCTDFEQNFFPGGFDEIRISSEALYTNDFAAPTEPLDVEASTILLYDFDQTEGGTVIDRSGNGNHGTVMGSPKWEFGGPVSTPSCDDGDPCTSDACDTGSCVHTPIPGCGEEPDCSSHAVKFDGESCIEIPDILNDGTEGYTLEMWFYAESDDLNQRVFDKIVDGNTSQPGFRLTYNDFPTLMHNLHYQEVKQIGNLHGVMTGKETVPSGQWIHYAFVRTPTGLAMRYLNGQALGPTQFNATIVDQSNDTPLWIGCEDFASHFMLGRIDELRISAGQRYSTDFEVKNVGFVTDDDTVALYHFDENGGDEVIDASGNGHHGTFHGNPTWIQSSPVMTDECGPGGDNPFQPGKIVLDEPLETLSGVIDQSMTATVSVWGAGGSGGYPGDGGAGAFARGTLELQAGDLLELVVAEGGKTKSGGGGASVITVNGEVMLIVGGGGGAGADGCTGCSGEDTDACVGCGGAAGAIGEDGQGGTGNNKYNTGSAGGQGGTQVAGGLGGVPNDQSIYDQPTCVGGDGGPHHGGASRQSTNSGPCNSKPHAADSEGGEAFINGAGGGGGSGHFGGGAGSNKWTYTGGGGGGGSSWAHASVSLLASEGGSLFVPGGTSDPEYGGEAGFGGQGGSKNNSPGVNVEPQLGHPGRIVLVLQ